MQRRRVVATFAAVSMGVLALGPAAGAESVIDDFAAESKATVLDAVLLGQQITVGLSGSTLDSTPRATGEGIGALTPAGAVSTDTTTATGDDVADDDKSETCGALPIPDLPLVTISVACASAFSNIEGLAADPTAPDGVPISRVVATSKVAALSVDVGDVLAALPLGDTEDAVDALIEPLDLILDGTPLGDQIDVGDTVNDLLAAITAGDAVLDVVLGASGSSSSAEGNVVISGATAPGATIEILNRDVVGLQPVVTVVTGAAKAFVSRNRTSGDVVHSVDPALVRVLIAPDVATGLGIPTEIEIPAGGAPFALELAPIGKIVEVAAAQSSTEDVDGGRKASASAVRVEVLRGTGDPGSGVAVLDLAAASAGVVGQQTVTQSAPEPEPESDAPMEELPPTGSDDQPIVPVAAAALGLFGLVACRRIASPRRSVGG